MPRYVILTHDHPFPHWDLLLESGDSCRTWRLLGEPAVGVVIAAEPLPHHRLHYLDYEGPVSGDRGTVTRWDWGTYSAHAQSSTGWRVDFDGQRGLRSAALTRDDAGDRWIFSSAPV